MVRRCREQHRAAAIVMDAERPCFADGTFDLVCGSLAAQWFADPPASIRGLQRLAAPGGALALTTLGPATLGEWGRARRAAGLASGGLAYPALGDLAAISGEGMETCLAEREMLRDPMPDALAFLGGLRAIGADFGDAAGSAGALRRAIRTLDRQADAITYELLTLIWQRRPEDGAQR
jgi:malonyl-CoA O-methyltransferase